MTRIAIIGSGIAGLRLAGALSGSADVVVFEKSRGHGGRLATRRATPFRFDHGAQFFTARSDTFRRWLEPLIADGVIASWHARFVELGAGPGGASRRWGDTVPHYVGVPGMSAIGRRLAEGLDVRTETRVERIRRRHGRWTLTDIEGDELGEFDWVVATAPAAQTAALMPPEFNGQAQLADTRMLGCYALMMGFTDELDLPFDAALVRDADLSWISIDGSKPGREGARTLVALASNAWAEANMEAPLAAVEAHMREVLRSAIGRELPEAGHTAVHRWRYANMATREGPRSLLDAEHRLAACGDWCVYGRVEGAFLSASDLAARLRPLL